MNRGIIPVNEEFEEVTEPVKVGGYLAFPGGKIVDAETGEEVMNSNGELTADVNNASTTTEQLSGGWGGKLLVFYDGVVDTIDPSSTPNPIQDAIDLIDANTTGTNKTNGDGQIHLPPGNITEASSLRSVGGKMILGRGWGSTVVEFTDLDAPAWDIQEFEDATRCYLSDFEINGSDKDNRTASLIHFSGTETPHATNIGRLRLRNSPDKVVWFENSHPFSCYWEYIRGINYDDRLLHFDDLMKGWDAGVIYGTPDSVSDDNYGVVNFANLSGTMSHIRQINCGGDATRALDANIKGNGQLTVEKINFEPSTGGSRGSVVRLLNGGATTIGSVCATNVTDIDQFVELRDAGRKHIGQLVKPGGVTVNNNYVAAFNDTVGPITYQGLSSEVDNDSGAALTYPISCLGDLTTVG